MARLRYYDMFHIYRLLITFAFAIIATTMDRADQLDFKAIAEGLSSANEVALGLGAMHVQGQAELQQWDKQKALWVKAAIPTKFDAWFDGILLAKYRVKLDPLISVWENGLAPFSLDEKEITSDGQTTVIVSYASGPISKPYRQREADIENVSGKKAFPMDAMGLSFLNVLHNPLPGKTIGDSGPSIIQKLENPGRDKIKISNSGNLVLISLIPEARHGFHFEFAFDKSKNFALVSSKYTIFDYSGQDTGTQREMRVDKLEMIPNTNFWVPTQMSLQATIRHVPLFQEAITISSWSFTKDAPENVFDPVIPPNTWVEDRRLNLSFLVGDSPKAVLNNVRAAVQGLPDTGNANSK